MITETYDPLVHIGPELAAVDADFASLSRHDVVDVYPTFHGNWRWRRIAGNNVQLSGPEDSYQNLSDCVAYARRCNVDCVVRVHDVDPRG